MGTHVYSVVKTELKNDNYEIKINGVNAETSEARVSACPYNRVWPGYQRSIDQTEIVSFVSFETDGGAELEIKTKIPFDKAEIRPKGTDAQMSVSNGVIKIKLNKPQYFTVEPYGRENALHIFADPIADYKKTGDMLYFGAGEHDAGNIELKSNQTLFIDEGAVVYASVTAHGAENIKILGRGILDNSKNKEKILYPPKEGDFFGNMNNAIRGGAVLLDNCKGVEIDGVTLRDSLGYNVHMFSCRDVEIKNIKIIGCWRYNSDGIDTQNCENVHISDCFLRTYDDSVCVKGLYIGQYLKTPGANDGMPEMDSETVEANDVTRNIVAENCVVWNDWGVTFEIGMECCAEEMTDIHFKNSSVIHSTITVMGCSNCDFAAVHGVTYENISVEYDDVIPQPKFQEKDSVKYTDLELDADYAPNTVQTCVEFSEVYSGGSTRRGKIYDIEFSNIHVYGRQKPKIYMKGYNEEFNCRDIRIKDFYWNGKKLSATSDFDTEFVNSGDGLSIE